MPILPAANLPLTERSWSLATLKRTWINNSIKWHQMSGKSSMPVFRKIRYLHTIHSKLKWLNKMHLPQLVVSAEETLHCKIRINPQIELSQSRNLRPLLRQWFSQRHSQAMKVTSNIAISQQLIAVRNRQPPRRNRVRSSLRLRRGKSWPYKIWVRREIAGLSIP